MNWLARATALLLLALWVPVTTHCRLEMLPALNFLSCCDHEDKAPHQDSDCDEDSCAAVESGAYRIDEHPQVKIPTLAALEPAPLGLTPEAILPAPTSLFAVTLSPPELATCWQFSFRAALPPRAPSFAS